MHQIFCHTLTVKDLNRSWSLKILPIPKQERLLINIHRHMHTFIYMYILLHYIIDLKCRRNQRQGSELKKHANTYVDKYIHENMHIYFCVQTHTHTHTHTQPYIGIHTYIMSLATRQDIGSLQWICNCYLLGLQTRVFLSCFY